MKTNYQSFLKSNSGIILFVLILVFQCHVVHSQQNEEPWWKNRPLRIYHPNMREYEAADLNVEEFIAGCRDINTEAIVFSTGGVYAFYDTKIPIHVKSPNMGERDLLKEVIEEAHKYDIRVIARFDFEKARPALFEKHPEWFIQNEENKPIANRSGNDDHFYKTNILGEYQNEAFAFPVLHEVFQNYDVDGVHLNAPGFSGQHFKKELVQKFNIPENPEEQQRWRAERLTDQMFKYRDIILNYNKEALFMAEINSPETPSWGTNRGFDHELLSGSYTNLLSTSGEANDLNLYKMRWWVSLTADWSHASNSPLSGVPLINLKAAFLKGKYALKPLHEYRFQCYQSMAHNAGIKAPTYGLINNMPDDRTTSMIAEPFLLMKLSEKYTSNVERLAQVALVWPAKEELGFNSSGYSEEMFGLYRTLISEHVLFDIVLAHKLTMDLAKKYESIIIPSAAILNSTQSKFLMDYAENGGNLLFLDASPEVPFPQDWAIFIGGEWSSEVTQYAYGISALNSQDKLPYIITLNQDVRRIETPAEATLLYTASPTPGGSFIPETYSKLKAGKNPLAMSIKKGEGSISYFAGNLGNILWSNDFPEYARILDYMLFIQSDLERKIILDAPGTVGLSSYKKEGICLLHLVNATGKIPLEKPVNVGPVNILIKDIAARKIELLQPGGEFEEIQGKVVNGKLRITLESLGAYSLIVIHTK